MLYNFAFLNFIKSVIILQHLFAVVFFSPHYAFSVHPYCHVMPKSSVSSVCNIPKYLYCFSHWGAFVLFTFLSVTNNTAENILRLTSSAHSLASPGFLSLGTVNILNRICLCCVGLPRALQDAASKPKCLPTSKHVPWRTELPGSEALPQAIAVCFQVMRITLMI